MPDAAVLDLNLVIQGTSYLRRLGRVGEDRSLGGDGENGLVFTAVYIYRAHHHEQEQNTGI